MSATLLPDQVNESKGAVLRAEDHVGLAFDYAMRFCRSGVPVEDTPQFSDACVGLLNAIKSFDPGRGYEFSTYAYYCMRSEVSKGHKDRQAKLSFEDSELDLHAIQNFKSIDYKILDILLSDHIDDSKADKIDKEMLRDKYLNEKTLSQLADQYEVSPARVHKRLKRAISRIQSRHKMLIEEHNE